MRSIQLLFFDSVCSLQGVEMLNFTALKTRKQFAGVKLQQQERICSKLLRPRRYPPVVPTILFITTFLREVWTLRYRCRIVPRLNACLLLMLQVTELTANPIGLKQNLVG